MRLDKQVFIADLTGLKYTEIKKFISGDDLFSAYKVGDEHDQEKLIEVRDQIEKKNKLLVIARKKKPTEWIKTHLCPYAIETQDKNVLIIGAGPAFIFVPTTGLSKSDIYWMRNRSPYSVLMHDLSSIGGAGGIKVPPDLFFVQAAAVNGHRFIEFKPNDEIIEPLTNWLTENKKKLEQLHS